MSYFCPILLQKMKESSKASDLFYELEALLDGYGPIESCPYRCYCSDEHGVIHDNKKGIVYPKFFELEYDADRDSDLELAAALHFQDYEWLNRLLEGVDEEK